VKSIVLRVYEELNVHLPEAKRKRGFVCRFEGVITVATLLGAIGIPLDEVDLILRNGESVKPETVVQDCDRISVYPVFEALDLGATTLVRSKPLRTPRFVTGPDLRRLAGRLRMLGFDSLACMMQSEAAETARTEHRILLVQREVLPGVSHMLRIRATRSRLQAAEVLEKLDLKMRIVPFGRCPRCNALTIAKDTGRFCQRCGRAYVVRITVQ
jgi:uncharacterized protein with PIN domain